PAAGEVPFEQADEHDDTGGDRDKTDEHMKLKKQRGRDAPGHDKTPSIRSNRRSRLQNSWAMIGDVAHNEVNDNLVWIGYAGAYVACVGALDRFPAGLNRKAV